MINTAIPVIVKGNNTARMIVFISAPGDEVTAVVNSSSKLVPKSFDDSPEMPIPLEFPRRSPGPIISESGKGNFELDRGKLFIRNCWIHDDDSGFVSFPDSEIIGLVLLLGNSMKKKDKENKKGSMSENNNLSSSERSIARSLSNRSDRHVGE